ncbi:MAG TPA: hypothetical protein VMW27_30470, partial [Thermoanaerobaculia bacterium]|nr:hypothetical protein [Thermoanaerobaculia bacterium]
LSARFRRLRGGAVRGGEGPGAGRGIRAARGLVRPADAYLADLWKRQQGPRLLVLDSVYGVEGDRSWPQSRSSRRAGSFKRAPDGLLMLHGEGIRTGALLTEARLVDVVPTLMYALGFPVARDLDGQVLTAAFDEDFLADHPLTFLPSYEALAKSPRAP